MSDDGEKKIVISIVSGSGSALHGLILGAIAHSAACAKVVHVLNLKNDFRLAEVSAAKADGNDMPPPPWLERTTKSNHNYSADRRQAKKNRRSK